MRNAELSSNQIRRRRTGIALLLVILFASAPLFVSGLYDGHDLDFHLYRIEAVKNALLDGQLPVRAAWSWANGYGYPTSIFYGDIFLYVPALLRLIGISVQDSYKTYVFLVNAAACLLAWYSFRQIVQDDLTAMGGRRCMYSRLTG